LKVRILYDLRRGWRYNTPNLEQCALLEISYHRLSEFCEKESLFEKDYLLGSINSQERQNILLHVLNYFRTAFAFNYYLLDDDVRPVLEERLKQRLHPDKEWSLEPDENLERPP